MVRIGPVTLNAPFFQAGLAGYSDAAMRLVARRHGAPYCVTEAMLDQFLIAGGKGLKAAELDEEDHPIAGQLMGSHPDDIAKGARILLKLGYDVIDINLACPVKKIRKKCRGGHLLQAPDEAAAILDAVRQAVGDDAPLTVKLRRGSDDSPAALANFHRIFEKVIELGYAGAVVHGRTVEQKYVGPSRWAFLRDLVRQYQDGGWRISDGGLTDRTDGEDASAGGVARSGKAADSVSSMSPAAMDEHIHPPSEIRHPPFLIGGSGDIWCAADIFDMIEQTGVQLVSVARGCIGNPWIFTQARALMVGDQAGARQGPSIEQQRQVLLTHFDLSVRLHGEEQASRMMRKFGIKFSRHHPQAEVVAQAFIAVKSTADWRGVLDQFYPLPLAA